MLPTVLCENSQFGPSFAFRGVSTMPTARFARTALFLLSAGGMGAAPPTLGQDVQTLRLESVSDIARGIPALPRLAPADRRPIANVNDVLQKADDIVREEFRECTRSGSVGDGPTPYWNRSIDLTLLGKRYFNLVETDENFCLGAHGAAWTKPWTFDLQTGFLVSWVGRPDRSSPGLLPADWTGEAQSDQVWNRIEIPVVISPQLQDLYRPAYDSISRDLSRSVQTDCQDVISAAKRFILWRDAVNDGIELKPSALPRAASVCAIPFTLSIATLRDFNFEPSLIEDIEAAHAQLGLLRNRQSPRN